MTTPDQEPRAAIRMDNIAWISPERYFYVAEPFLRELASLQINPQDCCSEATAPDKDDPETP